VPNTYVSYSNLCKERLFVSLTLTVTYFRPFQHGGKRTLYLVDTVAMVAQQASYIRHLTDLCVGEYSSSDTVDMFDIEDWEQEFQENQVSF
jgi:hypothetical protein